MFILCTGTKSIYNTDQIIRYCVDNMREDYDKDDDHWAIVADGVNNCSYFLAYFDTQEEANTALLDMMDQFKKDNGWILLDA